MDLGSEDEMDTGPPLSPSIRWGQEDMQKNCSSKMDLPMDQDTVTITDVKTVRFKNDVAIISPKDHTKTEETPPSFWDWDMHGLEFQPDQEMLKRFLRKRSQMPVEFLINKRYKFGTEERSPSAVEDSILTTTTNNEVNNSQAQSTESFASVMEFDFQETSKKVYAKEVWPGKTSSKKLTFASA